MNFNMKNYQFQWRPTLHKGTAAAEILKIADEFF